MSEINGLLPNCYEYSKYRTAKTNNSASNLSYDSATMQNNLHNSKSPENTLSDSKPEADQHRQLLDTWESLKSVSKHSPEAISGEKESNSSQSPQELIFVDNQWTQVHGIGCLDIDDGFASLEFYDTGEIHYSNRLNEGASWSMDVTHKQLEKAINLDVSFIQYMCDKSFWTAFLTEDITSDRLDEITKQLNQKETYNDILNRLPDELKNVWLKTEAETGINGFLADDKGTMLCLSEFAKKYITASIKQESTDLLGCTQESLLKFAAEALDNLNAPDRVVYNEKIQDIKNAERNFYQKLLENVKSI